MTFETSKCDHYSEVAAKLTALTSQGYSFHRPNCPRLNTVETMNITEEQLNNIGSAVSADSAANNTTEPLQWSNLESLPLLPSFVKAFNIEGNLVCIACKPKETSTF